MQKTVLKLGLLRDLHIFDRVLNLITQKICNTMCNVWFSNMNSAFLQLLSCTTPLRTKLKICKFCLIWHGLIILCNKKKGWITYICFKDWKSYWYDIASSAKSIPWIGREEEIAPRHDDKEAWGCWGWNILLFWNVGYKLAPQFSPSPRIIQWNTTHLKTLWNNYDSNILYSLSLK